ncbi:hypothetical protein F5877DRAFT_79093 [Lentinula edodes]|nr:hypothetical protein F5877DRAFT_79093 [Lentinula edodes]
MFPDQGIGSFAPRRCKDNNFAVVGESSFLITPSFLHLAGHEYVELIYSNTTEFELDTSKGLIVQDKRSMRSSSSSLFSLGRGKSDVILSPTMKSNAMATMVTDKAAEPPALRYVSYKISTSADGAWAEMKNGKRGKGRMSID